jgi:hypothetical protein
VDHVTVADTFKGNSLLHSKEDLRLQSCRRFWELAFCNLVQLVSGPLALFGTQQYHKDVTAIPQAVMFLITTPYTTSGDVPFTTPYTTSGDVSFTTPYTTSGDVSFTTPYTSLSVKNISARIYIVEHDLSIPSNHWKIQPIYRSQQDKIKVTTTITSIHCHDLLKNI